jgi:hypothetical protein
MNEQSIKRMKINDKKPLGSIEKKLILSEHKLHELQSFTSELIANKSKETKTLNTLVDPLINIEILLLRKKILDLENINTKLSLNTNNDNNASLLSTLTDKNQAFLINKIEQQNILNITQDNEIKSLQLLNDEIKKSSGEVVIRGYLRQIDLKDKYISKLSNDISENKSTILDLQKQTETLSEQNFMLQLQVNRNQEQHNQVINNDKNVVSNNIDNSIAIDNALDNILNSKTTVVDDSPLLVHSDNESDGSPMLTSEDN